MVLVVYDTSSRGSFIFMTTTMMMTMMMMMTTCWKQQTINQRSCLTVKCSTVEAHSKSCISSAATARVNKWIFLSISSNNQLAALTMTLMLHASGMQWQVQLQPTRMLETQWMQAASGRGGDSNRSSMVATTRASFLKMEATINWQSLWWQQWQHGKIIMQWKGSNNKAPAAEA